ncbi:hypothetical protein BHM03_00007419 [Ensete ventricosum]|nr:hypothetical protein BHM03_00007419 [Ensete ventricosum]
MAWHWGCVSHVGCQGRRWGPSLNHGRRSQPGLGHSSSSSDPRRPRRRTQHVNSSRRTRCWVGSAGTWWPAGSTSSGRGLARRARNHSIDRTRRFRGALRFALASDRRRFTRVPSRGRIAARDSSAEPSCSDPTRDCDTQGTVVTTRSLGRGPFRRSSPLYALRFASKSDDPSGSWTVTARVLLRGPRAPCSRSNV